MSNQKTQTTGKVKLFLNLVKVNILYFILAVVLATAFFAHETIIIDNWKNHEKGQLFTKQKKEALKSLGEFKQVYSHTPEYKAYKLKADARDKTQAELKPIIESYKFGSYKTFQQWVGEFGWAFGLFIYSLFNLVLSFIRKTKTHFGEITLHFTIITIAIFFIHYTFQVYDFSSLRYFVMNILMACGCVVSSYLFVRYKSRYYKSLISNIRLLTRFIVENKPKEETKEYVKSYVSTFKKLIKL